MEPVVFEVPDLDPNHCCGYREAYLELKKFLETVVAGQQLDIQRQGEELRELKQRVTDSETKKFRRKSEKLQAPREPKPEQTSEEKAEARAKADEKRRQTREDRKKLPEVEFNVEIPSDQRVCETCAREMKAWSKPKTKVLYTWVPGHLAKHCYNCETLSCQHCGDNIVSAPPPKSPFQGCQSFDAGFVAEIIVRKCGDAMPLHRLQKSFRRDGFTVSESSLGRMFQEAGRHLEVIWERMKELIAQAELVQADETFLKLSNHPERVPGNLKTCYMWAFIDAETERFVYVFSVSRSGATPAQVLGTTPGKLVVDAYTGYNTVTTVEGRQRGGCNSHARRRFVELLSTFKVQASQALEFYRRLYGVEHEAFERGISQSDEHLALRQEKSALIMAEFKAWLEETQVDLPKQSSLRKACNYALNNWAALTLFLTDARIPLDNNLSERTLRALAVGRKNWLFLGSEESGKHSAILHTLVKNCELAGVNAWLYLADLVMKTPGELAEKVDEFLPWTWKPPDHVKVGAAYPAYPPEILVTPVTNSD